MTSKNEFSGMRELTSFQMDHSVRGDLILLKTSFIDTLTGLGLPDVPHYPDLDVMLRLSTAKTLMQELLKRIDYIEAGIEHDHRIIM